MSITVNVRFHFKVRRQTNIKWVLPGCGFACILEPPSVWSLVCQPAFGCQKAVDPMQEPPPALPLQPSHCCIGGRLVWTWGSHLCLISASLFLFSPFFISLIYF